MYKNLKTPQLNAWGMKLRRVQDFFHAKQHFYNGSQGQNSKDQEINRIKSKKINRTVESCTTATNRLI